MKENLTDINCLLDRSGSMSNIIDDAIGGFNQFLKDQKAVPGEAKLTVALFDDEYEIIHNGVDIQSVPEITSEIYVPRGWTAMLDAIGKMINTTGERLAKLTEEERPSKVIMVILTDGLENKSKEFNGSQIKEMIEHQKNNYAWTFIFLGANIDAATTAVDLGISINNAMQFASNGDSQIKAYNNMSKSLARTRGMDTMNYMASLDNSLLADERNAE